MAPNVDSDAIQVVVVDDDREASRGLLEFLANEGFHARALPDPTKVEAEIRASDVHILVLELELGRRDGLELIREVRSIDNDVSIVIHTSSPSFESAQRAIRYGVDGYLTKPFDPDDLRERLAEITHRKGLDRTPEDRVHRALGNFVRERRLELGLTLKAMARRTGLSVSLLSQIERAESSASITSLYKIAKALNRRIAELFRDA
jgi:DNA-binding response OmpR family regulator